MLPTVRFAPGVGPEKGSESAEGRGVADGKSVGSAGEEAPAPSPATTATRAPFSEPPVYQVIG